ncbi:MAG: carbohydrate ABC transporter permease, partial [Candidatus Omnitrophica bacterium]|nr:carbohydrate ABC transporter permease [Candidatus Omnitrophota bacterium]
MRIFRTHTAVPDSESESIYQILRFLLLLFFGIAFALPFLWTVSTSLKPLSETTKMPPEWLPRTTIYKAEINGTQISRAEVSWTPPENRIDPTEQFPADVDIAWVRPHGSEVAYRAVPKKNLELQGRVIDFRWENYVGAVHAIPFWRYTKNTLWLCVLSVFGTLLSSALVAYGFSRIQWRGRDQLFLLVLATMMIPFPVIMIPLYSLFRGFGLIGTMVPL